MSKSTSGIREQLLKEIRITQLAKKELDKELQSKSIRKKDYEFHKSIRDDEAKRNKYLQSLEHRLALENDKLREIRKEQEWSERKPAVWMTAVIILTLGLLIISNFSTIQELTGLVTGTKEETVIQDIGTFFTNSSTFELNVTNMTSVRVNGKILGEGRTRILLEMNGQVYVIVDKDTTIKEGIGLTGYVIDETTGLNMTRNETNTTTELKVNETLEVNQTANETVEINVTLNETTEINESVEVNETIEINKTINETTNESAEVNETIEINETVEENVTEPEVNITEPEVNISEPEEPITLETAIEGECIDTCELPIEGGKIIIELENTNLELESLVFTHEQENSEPEQTAQIENIILTEPLTISAEDYFTDADNDPITLDMKSVAGVSSTITGSTITLSPIAAGTYETYLYYTDGYVLKRSNDFNITVPGGEIIINETNETNLTNQTGGEIIPPGLVNETNGTTSVEIVYLPVGEDGLITINSSNAARINISITDKHGKAIGKLKKIIGEKSLKLEIQGKEKTIPGKALGLNKKKAKDQIVKPEIAINNIRAAPPQLDIIIDDTTQGLTHGNITTPVIYADHFLMEKAEISLPYTGEVNKIMRCSNFVKETFMCAGWEMTNIPFTKNDTHIKFEASRFSAYAGANITIITLQSFPTVNGEWITQFSTIGKAPLTIEGWNGTIFGVDLEHLSLMCGDEQVFPTVNGNIINYSDYECNQTSSHTVRVLTDGPHTQKFTFGDSVGYSKNLASNVPKTINIQGKLTDDAGANVNGSHNFSFKLYTVPSGGSHVWEENQTLDVDDGVYDAILGSSVTLNISFDGQYYLGVEVDEDGEMTPRINLTSTPYTERSRRTDSVDCTDCINSSHIQNDSITNDDISSTAAILQSKINGTAIVQSDNFGGDVSGTYDTIDIGADTISNVEILDDSINGSDLNATNTPIDNYILSYDAATGGFTWVLDKYGNTTASGGWLNDSTVTYTSLAVNVSNFFFVNASRVGIGTMTPTHALHVVGSVNITNDLYLNGTLYGSGADIAEKIPSSEELEPGDVVIIDVNRPETVRKSYSPYSDLVAGIVTTDPAITIGKNVGGTPIALAGRVPVKVTDENGPVIVGDLLTTSSKPGYAMRCDYKYKCIGAIVGKALQPLNSGSGKITALVTLY